MFITVPSVKPLLIFLSLCHKSCSVCRNILMFVAIKIHPILHGEIMPAKPLQPSMCSVLTNCGARNSRAWELFLHYWTSHNLNNIVHCYIATLAIGHEPRLKSLWYVFIVKNIPSEPAIVMHRKFLRTSRGEDLLPKFLHMLHTTALDFGHHYWHISPAVPKIWVKIEVVMNQNRTSWQSEITKGP